MLEGRTLSYRYGKDKPWVLQNVDLHVAPGEIVGLQGVSGRGKTTLAKLLAGFLRPTEGTVLWQGQPLPPRSYHPVQLIFQHPELAINPRWRIDRVLAESHGGASEVLEALHIDSSWLTRFPHELSGGELQRIAVARVLNPQTRCLICDEITAMLDAVTQAQIWSMILDFARRHDIGMLVISHEAPLVERLCTRTLAL